MLRITGARYNCTKRDLAKIQYEVVDNEGEGYSPYKKLKFIVEDFILGDKLIYTVTRNRKIPDLKNHFSSGMIYGRNMYEYDTVLTIESEAPLFVKTNKVKNIKIEATPHKVVMTQLKPMFHSFNNYSDEAVYVNQNEHSYIKVGTDKTWEDLRKKEVINYKIKNYPKSLDKITKLVKDQKTLELKLKTISLWIIKNHTYFGDWKRVNGGFKPRSLKKIFDTKYGDCKDLSQLTTEILKKSGLDASVAFVDRGSNPDTAVYDMPSTSAYFNHAIVQVYDNGKRYWLDPTNKYFGFGFIPDDIIAKHSLVIEGKGRGLTYIDPKDSKYTIIEDKSKVRHNGKNFITNQVSKNNGLEVTYLAKTQRDKSPKEMNDEATMYYKENYKEDLIGFKATLGKNFILDYKILEMKLSGKSFFEFDTNLGKSISLSDSYSGLFEQLIQYPSLQAYLALKERK